MGFAFSKLGALTRRRRPGAGAEDGPIVRRADAHPDARPRRPIFASSDFNAPDIFAAPVIAAGRPADTEPFPEVLADPAPETVPGAVEDDGIAAFAEPTPETDSDGAEAVLHESIESTTFISEPALADMPAPSAAPLDDHRAYYAPAPLEAPSPLHALGVGELVQRLEAALVRRQAQGGQGVPAAPRLAPGALPVLADIPPAAPVPVRACVDARVDAALADALGALRHISGGR